MHGREHRDRERRTLRLSAPRLLVLPAAGSMLPGTPANDSRSGPDARNGFSLPGNRCPSRGSDSRIDVPSLFLRANTRRFHSPFGPSAPPSEPVRPGSGSFTASGPLPIHRPASEQRFQLPLPFGTVTSLRLKAFHWARCHSARLPAPPDLPSLPAAISISRVGHGSSFQVRYISGGLLFLKPLGTFLTMRPNPFAVNAFISFR